MKLFAFWPTLVLLSVPNTVVLYWERGAPEYADQAACEARLPDLEAHAREDVPFLAMVRSINHGVMPELSFSRECSDKPPNEFHDKLLHERGPGEKT